MTGLAANRCPECGRAFDPKDEATFLTTSSQIRLTRPQRVAIVVVAFAAWLLASMWEAGPSTSWEHHSFGGPFVIIKESLGESHGASDWAIALLFWAFFCAFPLHWIITSRTWSAIGTLILCAVTLMMSMFAAHVAGA